MTNKFKDSRELIHDEFLDTFGREFCKHQVLWKPNAITNDFEIQTATHSAYHKLAQALNLSVKAVLELLETFPAACLDLMSYYEMQSRIDAGCGVPDWLTPLARHFRLLNNSTKCYNFEANSSHDLVRALWESARAGLGDSTGPAGVSTGPGGASTGPAGASAADAEKETEDETSPLRGSRAVARFVARHRVTEKQVLPAWLSVLQLCCVKHGACACVGDRLCLLPVSLRPAASERWLADLALLHDRSVSQIEILTPAKLRTLVLLFQLIVAAKETYDAEERRRCDGSGDRDGRTDDRMISRPARDRTDETRDDERPTATTAMIGDRVDPPEIRNTDRRTDTTSAPNGPSSTFRLLNVEPCSTLDFLRETVVERRTDRRETVDLSDATAEESSDRELHTELDLEPDVQFVSSDTSDFEISKKYSKNKIGAPSLLAKNRNKDSGSNIIETFNIRSSEERESDISSKSGLFDTESEHTPYWYEESKCNSSDEQRVVWALVYTELLKRGRSASLISLQHRWVELLHRARVALLKAWSSHTLADRNVHPLLLMVAHRFPGIVTESFPSWKTLVLERQIVLESDIKDIINKYLENGSVILNITENITWPDLLKEYVIDKDEQVLHCRSKNNTTCLIQNKKSSSIIDNIDEYLEEESQAQDGSINKELNVNSCISTVLDQIDPSKARISIIFDEDSDEDAEDENNMNVREATSDLNNLHASNDSRGATNLTEENNQIPNPLTQCKQLTEIAMKNVDEQLEDKLNYINNPANPPSDLSVKNINIELNENCKDSTFLIDKETDSHDYQDELSLLQPRKIVDEKLVNISRVVVTPIEHLPEWKKHSRNGVIKCRNFSVKNLTKLVNIDSISKNQLSKYTPCINTNISEDSDSEKYENENYMKNEVRIKFEDDNFESDFEFDDDINNGIIYQKYIELYTMPDHLRKNRIKLTRKLKLSRTYFSLNFWCSARNIELLKLCKPMTIKLNKGLPRVAKRVELADINEVRRMNRSILTAQVSPTVDTTPPSIQRFSESQEALNTTRRTNNSLSSALDGSELLQLLTNYAIRTKIPKNVPEPATKDIIADGNLMDSIIDTMRLGEKNNIQSCTITPTLHSLQQSPFPSSNPSQMLIESCNNSINKNNFATNTFNTTEKPAEEERNNHNLNSINHSLPEATVRQIQISSNYRKTLDMKHLQTINKITNTSLNLEDKDLPSSCDLRGMIILLIKQFDTKMMKHENSMKLNRSSLNLHLRNFEKQQRALVKNISKLTKILPQYVLNMKPKRKNTKKAIAAKKRKEINIIKCQQSKEHCTLPGSSTDNINNIDNNTSTVFVVDDDEPNLVIDERSLEPSDNIDLNNSQINKKNNNKSIQDTCNVRKQENKDKKQIKRSRRKSKHKTKISEEDEPMLNEYQEWQRQKTMALKYFTLPMSDTSKITSKDKIAQQQSTSTLTDQQSHGCQTNITMKRKNTEDLATTSTASDITKRSKLHPNESDVVCISDASSDDDVQIIGCYNARDTAPANRNKNNPNTATQTQPDVQQIDETENNNQIVFLTSANQMVNQSVINTPVAAMTESLYFIVNDTQVPAATPEATNTTQCTETVNDPLLFKKVSNAAPFSTLTQMLSQNNSQETPVVLVNEDSESETLSPGSHTLRCQKAFNDQCTCIECQSTLRPDDILTYSLNAIQNVTSQDLHRFDSKTNEPSNLLLEQSKHLFQEAITVKDYLSSNKQLTALIKVNGSKNLLFFCSKYIVLTDVNIPSKNATYRTTFKINKFKFLSQVLVPREEKGNVLLLGPKGESDYIHCNCVKGTRTLCSLCHRIKINLPNSSNFLKINSDYYKKLCSMPIKYVRLNKIELVANNRVVLEGNPHLILINQMFFKMLTDSPLTYVRILSAVPDAASLRHLVRRQVGLYTFDVTQTHLVHARLLYAQTERQVTVDHSDDKLVKVMQWILN